MCSNTECIGWSRVYTYLHTVQLNERPDLIVAISRGGLPIGVILSHRLVTPLYTASISLYDRKEQEIDVSITETTQGKKILLVDDISDSGESFKKILNKISEKYAVTSNNIKTLSFCLKEGTSYTPDYYSIRYPKDVWIIFPWETQEIVC